jgi:hypothetical protein
MGGRGGGRSKASLQRGRLEDDLEPLEDGWTQQMAGVYPGSGVYSRLILGPAYIPRNDLGLA